MPETPTRDPKHDPNKPQPDEAEDDNKNTERPETGENEKEKDE